MNYNPSLIKLTDSYKVSHYRQYPPKTTSVFSFFESRGGDFPEVTFFGLQYLLKRYLVGTVVTNELIDEAEAFLDAHFGGQSLFNRKGWERIVNVYGGKLPVTIKAVPEGTTVPVSNVMMTIENNDPELYWLTNYLETLLVQVWYPTTVATQSRSMKRDILRFLELTGDPSLINFKLHDFGFRGSSSVESAGIGGLSHLVNFVGSDTLEALSIGQVFYNEPMAGFSIPAAEHSTITSWGKENEAEAYENMLDAFPTGFVAVVSDSYDIFNACKNIWGGVLKAKVLNRNGTLVVRPDSGDPPTVVVQVLDILGEQFGYTINAKGYKVLPPQIRVIQGDGIDRFMMVVILKAIEEAGWSADNVTFGSGGGLLQKVNRDTLKFAFKCSAVDVDGVWYDVMKDPVTDHGKKSKAGRLVLTKDSDEFKTMREDQASSLGRQDELITVFKNGELLVDHKFADIRSRASIS